MKIEGQVVNLELNQKLKELGFKQDTVWYWIYDEYNEKYYIQREAFDDLDTIVCSAFTVAELAERLPSCVVINHSICYFLSFNKWRGGHNIKWGIVYDRDGLKEKDLKGTYDDSLANAMAKMLIWLIQNKHMEVPK